MDLIHKMMIPIMLGIIIGNTIKLNDTNEKLKAFETQTKCITEIAGLLE